MHYNGADEVRSEIREGKGEQSMLLPGLLSDEAFPQPVTWNPIQEEASIEWDNWPSK